MNTVKPADHVVYIPSTYIYIHISWPCNDDHIVAALHANSGGSGKNLRNFLSIDLFEKKYLDSHQLPFITVGIFWSFLYGIL